MRHSFSVQLFQNTQWTFVLHLHVRLGNTHVRSARVRTATRKTLLHDKKVLLCLSQLTYFCLRNVLTAMGQLRRTAGLVRHKAGPHVHA